jgi:hypothetical protein
MMIDNDSRGRCTSSIKWPSKRFSTYLIQSHLWRIEARWSGGRCVSRGRGVVDACFPFALCPRCVPARCLELNFSTSVRYLELLRYIQRHYQTCESTFQEPFTFPSTFIKTPATDEDAAMALTLPAWGGRLLESVTHQPTKLSGYSY